MFFSAIHATGAPVTPGGDDGIRTEVITRARPDGGTEKVSFVMYKLF
jgi:hypothetical protein